MLGKILFKSLLLLFIVGMSVFEGGYKMGGLMLRGGGVILRAVKLPAK